MMKVEQRLICIIAPAIQLSLFLFFSALPNELKEEIKKELTAIGAAAQLNFSFNNPIKWMPPCFIWWIWKEELRNLMEFPLLWLGGASQPLAGRQLVMGSATQASKAKGSHQWSRKKEVCEWSEINGMKAILFHQTIEDWLRKRMPPMELMSATPHQAKARQAHQQNQTFLSPAAREEMLIVVEWGGLVGHAASISFILKENEREPQTHSATAKQQPPAINLPFFLKEKNWFACVALLVSWMNIITVLDCTNRYCNDLGWSVVRCEKPIEHRYILFSFH